VAQTINEEPPMMHKGPMRWCNPKLEDFEWREVPASDEEALTLLESYPGSQAPAEAYREWRGLGASIMTALIRAGEAAREREKGEPIA
jgi:hypothetical protein